MSNIQTEQRKSKTNVTAKLFLHRKIVLVVPSVDHPEADVMQSSMLQSTGRSELQQNQTQSQDKGADAKAVQHKTVVALKGQLLHWRLLVANSGQLCLTVPVMIHRTECSGETRLCSAYL